MSQKIEKIIIKIVRDAAQEEQGKMRCEEENALIDQRHQQSGGQKLWIFGRINENYPTKIL